MAVRKPIQELSQHGSYLTDYCYMKCDRYLIMYHEQSLNSDVEYYNLNSKPLATDDQEKMAELGRAMLLANWQTLPDSSVD
jgi:hypothetical protein